jgi:hypothetical protein
MLRTLVTALCLTSLCAAADLKIVRAMLSDSDGGVPNGESWEYTPGQIIYFTCRVSGFTPSAKREIQLNYTVQAFDSRGAAVAEADKGSINDELTAQDKEWLPKVDATVILPPQMLSGTGKIVLKVEDAVSKTSATLEAPFRVRGSKVEPAEKLAISNFRFLKGENDARGMEHAVYHPGDQVWAAFELVGYKYGEKNHVDVTYLTELVNADGKSLWKQPQPEGEQSDAFYPKPFVSAEMGVTLDKNIKPGTYTLILISKDAVGNQTAEHRGEFVVE